jgi:hypothetical protein
MKNILLLVLSILFLFCGCSSPFMEKEFVLSLDNNSESSSRIIYYEEVIDFSDLNDVRQYVKKVVRIGLGSKTLPGILDVTDNGVYKLTSFNARILNKDKIKKSYRKSDLSKYNLSSSYQISSSSVYFLPIEQVVRPGDFIETVAEYKYTLPQLGIYFDQPNEMSPGSEYKCVVIIPSGYSISYRTVNSLSQPEVVTSENKSLRYIFKGRFRQEEKINNPFAKSFNQAGVLVTFPIKSSINNEYTWKDFGSWYADSFEEKTKPGAKLKETVSQITAGLTTNLQKLEAIFNYVQKNVRYEQVYLALGEFIPNDCSVILERGYGDCKDYSALIYAMAKAAGITTSPAICFRGRGQLAFEDIAVSQFNHVIIHYTQDNNDYWLDGTNRSGIFGVTTSDLINQYALIVNKENPYIKQISNIEDNLLRITGTLTPFKSDLNGDLTIYLSGQYAIDFFYYDYILNKKKIVDHLQDWSNNHLNNKIKFNNIVYGKDAGGYSIKANCTLPNSLVKIDSFYYCSGLQAFPSIIPQLSGSNKEDDIWFYPKPAKVNIAIEIPGLYNGSDEGSFFKFDYKWSLDPGPYTENDRKEFLRQFRELQETLSKKHKLVQRVIL